MDMKRPGKGIRGSVRRAALIPTRYGIGPEKIRTRLQEMTSVLARWECVATVPVAAALLDRYGEVARDLKPFDVGIHGYSHVAYDSLTRQGQAADLQRALAALSRHGFDPRGFRAPYLRMGEGTRELLRDCGLLWDSSSPRFLLPAHHAAAADAKRLCDARYRMAWDWPAGAGTAPPIELPVALPDDEILVDGLGITNSASLTRVFDAMLHEAYSSGSILAFQVHPERFHLCAEAVRTLLERATDLGAWSASLSEVAEWTIKGESSRWPRSHSMAMAITGDLDAIALGDFARRVLGK